MANKKKWLGISAVLLVFGLVLAGCDNGTGGGGGNGGGNWISSIESRDGMIVIKHGSAFTYNGSSSEVELTSNYGFTVKDINGNPSSVSRVAIAPTQYRIEIRLETTANTAGYKVSYDGSLAIAPTLEAFTDKTVQ
jgi:hypothetical protein